MNDGLTQETAIVLENNGAGSIGPTEIYNIVEKKFGGNDGDYFLHSETTLTDKKTDRLYRVLLIEDSTGTKRQVFFDITNW